MHGYGAALGPPTDDFANLRKEPRSVFPDSPIKVCSCVPLRDTGLRSADYTFLLEGVPDCWDRYVLHSMDIRVPPQAVDGAG